MTGILDQIRRTTPETLVGVTGDFSDAPRPTYRPRVEREMIRDVKGATDLRDAMPVQMPNMNAGQVTVDPDLQRRDTRPFQGQPTDRQRGLMNMLMEQLERLDRDAWSKGMDYIQRMDEAGAWNPARDENVSRWITSLRNKIADLKAAPVAVAAPKSYDKFEDIPSGYYAYAGNEGSDDIKFFRVTHKDGRGQYAGRHFVNVYACASDERHPVKVWSARKTILDKIRALGPAECMALYGQKIGSCGRCHRTLTDEVSRSRGIGPDCWGKM